MEIVSECDAFMATGANLNHYRFLQFQNEYIYHFRAVTFFPPYTHQDKKQRAFPMALYYLIFTFILQEITYNLKDQIVGLAEI